MPAPPSVILLPEPAAYDTERETQTSAQQTRDRDERKEVPEPANEFTARELSTEKLPREGRRADEPDEERTVSGDILDGGASQLIELGLNDSSRADAPRKRSMRSGVVGFSYPRRKRNLSLPTLTEFCRESCRPFDAPFAYRA